MLSRDDESSLNDDEYKEVKNDADIPKCPAADDTCFSTLGSPFDATPITPRPIPTEIQFQQPSCLKKSVYASIQRDNTYPPIVNDRSAPTKSYLATSFEPTPLDAISEVPPYDTFTTIDSLLSHQRYTDLVGESLSRTPSELKAMEEDRFLELLETHTDADDPILSTKIDLRKILFTNQQYHLTEEEELLPSNLLHNEDMTVNAYATKTWHRTLHKDLDPQKLRPFLGFRPIDIVRKTLSNTTQYARLIIRYPFRKHVKARFPLLNTRRINEGISSDRLYANCPDAGFGYNSAHVFYGMKTTNIQVYGHRPGGDGFFNCYKDFCRDHGVPSALRRDNAQELKSNKVLDFNREHLIRDEFSEVENQQQNVVESGGIRWLKSAIHVLLDMTGAPAWTWFLAATYLADVHNHTWNNEREFIPSTARDGVTKDISRLLQFVFWERVLYLDHVDSFPQSKERPGYFVGCSPNVGDDLTFRIYDDQTKQVVSVSVVRPYTSNKRVKWDATTLATSIRPKLKQPSETWHPTPSDDDIMDQYDHDEPNIDSATDPDLFFEPPLERIKKYDSVLEVPDLCLIPPSIDNMLKLLPAQDDAYTGKSLLRFSPLPMKMHPELKKPSRIKRKPSSTVTHDKEINPPLTNDITELKEMLKLSLIGQRISKRFEAGIFLGTVTSTWTDDDHQQYWRVRYDDDDGEDLNLDEIRDSLALYKLYPHEHRFGSPPTTITPDISNDRGADISIDRGVDISNERGATTTNDRGATTTNERGATTTNERGADTTNLRRSTRNKRKEKLPEQCLKTIARLGIILFTSSAIVQPNVTSVQPPISAYDIDQAFPSEPVHLLQPPI